MGQKSNPNILRLGKTRDWNSNYSEKKSSEYSIYEFKNFEIKQFIKTFFSNEGLLVGDIKLNYSTDSINIKVLYFLSSKSNQTIGTLNMNQKLRLSRKTKKKSLRKKKNNYLNHYFLIENNIEVERNSKNVNLESLKKAIRIERASVKLRRLKFIKYYKQLLLKQHYKTIKKLNSNDFLQKFFESISLFLNTKKKISLTIRQLNKNIRTVFTEKQLETLKKKFVQIRRYSQNDFFKESVNLIFFALNNKQDSSLLAEFIANQLKRQKKHNFFLKFLKTTLSLFNNKELSIAKGIKIKLKGRLNGRPRAGHKIIYIGKRMPIMSLGSHIEHSKATAFTPNGTLGVNLWVYY